MQKFRAATILSALAILLIVLLVIWAPTRILAWLTPSAGVGQQLGIAYGPHERLKLDAYTPNRDETTTPAAAAKGAPLVVFFYGGSWNSGHRATYRFVGQALASRGFATVIADYRLYPQVRYPDFLHDAALAVAWAVKNAQTLGADPRRIVIAGHSAGAYNAAMLALDPRWLREAGVDQQRISAWFGLAGPYEFLPIQNPDVKPVFFHPNYPANTQPIDFVGAHSPPTFLGAARDDDLVNPVRNSVALGDRLRQAGVPVTLRLYDQLSHTTLIASLSGPGSWFVALLDDLTLFLGSIKAADSN